MWPDSRITVPACPTVLIVQGTYRPASGVQFDGGHGHEEGPGPRRRMEAHMAPVQWQTNQLSHAEKPEGPGGGKCHGSQEVQNPAVGGPVQGQPQ